MYMGVLCLICFCVFLHVWCKYVYVLCVCARACAGKDENIRTNLRLYGLEDHYLDVLVADAAYPVWRPREIFDAIITDRTFPLLRYMVGGAWQRLHACAYSWTEEYPYN